LTELEDTRWVDSCRICKKEVCSIVDHFVKTKRARSVRDATRMLSEQLEGEIPRCTLEKIYHRNKVRTNVCTPKPIKPLQIPEKSKAICDLSELTKAGEKFSTIYADPPWSYENQSTRAAVSGEYQTMSLKEISNLPVKNLTEENAHLHLWTTNGFLHEALHLITEWGFKYKSCLVWVKPQMGIGNYWRVSHEFLLLGIKGNLRFSDKGLMSWIQAKRTRHSAKPEIVRTMIEKASPPRYLELFGRKLTKNWTVFGNQIEKNLFD